jgi:cell division protein FtsL
MTRVASILFWFGLTLAVSLVLYGTSNRAQELSKQLRALNHKIEAEQINIHVLKAEWVYLANPTRIETAARKYLAMHPTAMKQIASLDDLPKILPTPREEKAMAAIKNKAVAARQASLLVDKPDDSAHVNTYVRILTSAEKREPDAANPSAHDNDSLLLAVSAPR